MFSQSESPRAPSDKDGGEFRRSFRMEGKLGGLRYDVGARISELIPGGSRSREGEIVVPPERNRIVATPVARDACGDPLEVWESEGGH